MTLPMNLDNYEFDKLGGLTSCDWNSPLHFVGTGMAHGYALNWMSTADDRRDWAKGISGSHLAAEPETCFRELGLTSPPYPDDSYRIVLRGNLRLLDLRCVQSSAFSGDYYSTDRSFSCQIIERNRDYIESGHYDGILRYSQPLLANGQYSEVIALTPAAIGKLSAAEIYGLGNSTCQLTITWPDGTVSNPDIIR